MITGIAAPADNRLQRTARDKVPRHERRAPPLEPGRVAQQTPHHNR